VIFAFIERNGSKPTPETFWSVAGDPRSFSEQHDENLLNQIVDRIGSDTDFGNPEAYQRRVYPHETIPSLRIVRGSKPN